MVRQGLCAAPSSPFAKDDLRQLIHQLGFVQIDSIRTVERAHHMILFARNQNYKPEQLRQLLEDDRHLFEHWTHDASVIPIQWFGHWSHRFERMANKQSNSAWFAERIGPDADKIIAGVLAPHRSGIPGVNLHCAMHSYRFGDFRKPVKAGAANAKWFEYIGVQSTGHGPKKPISISFEHNVPFITKGIKDWTTGNEELYNNVQVLPTSKVVARGTQGKSKAVVAWTNDYNGVRVFSTSLGHNNFTVADSRYLDFVARGLLWAVKSEDAPIKKAGK